MKKITSILLAIVCALSLCVNTFAAYEDETFEISEYAAQTEESLYNDFSNPDNVRNEIYSYTDGSMRLSSISTGTSAVENFTNIPMSQFSQRGSGMYTGALENAGDIAGCELEIDHSITPKALVCVYPFVTTNDFNIKIYGEDSRLILDSNVTVNENDYRAKRFYPISSTDGHSEKYIILITALEDVTGFGLTIGTEENFAEDFGGGQTCPTVPKNIPYGELAEIGGTRYFTGYRALLNTRETFLYVADGETFITVGSEAGVYIDFSVYDLDDEKEVYRSVPTDHYQWYFSDTYYNEGVSRRLDLEAGKAYLFTFFSNSHQVVDKLSDYYKVWLGLPNFRGRSIDYTSPIKYLSANKRTTFSFPISGYPESARVSINTRFNVRGSNPIGAITYCQITAPNGYSFLAPYGQKTSLPRPDIYNYLKSPNNIPINGTWKVTITSSDVTPDLKFKISGSYTMIPGDDVN